MINRGDYDGAVLIANSLGMQPLLHAEPLPQQIKIGVESPECQPAAFEANGDSCPNILSTDEGIKQIYNKYAALYISCFNSMKS